MSVAAAVAVLVGVLVTGAFHEDGLADTADAIAGGWTVERRLPILEDPRHGTYGVAALCGSIVLRVVAVAALAATAGRRVRRARSPPTRSARGAAVATMGVVPVAPTGRPRRRATPAPSAAVRAAAGALVAVGIAAVATGWWAAPLVARRGVAAARPSPWSPAQALGGITGDVLGAIEQVVECLVLVVATALAARSGVVALTAGRGALAAKSEPDVFGYDDLVAAGRAGWTACAAS